MARNQSSPPKVRTVIKLAVDLLTVDNVEAVGNSRLHGADLKVEPLVVLAAVHVSIHNQIILKPGKQNMQNGVGGQWQEWGER